MEIELRDLIKIHVYRGEYTVVYNVANYTFKPGKLYYIYDSKSSGKTTLLEMLSLNSKYDEGKIIINGKESKKIPPFERARMRNQNIGYASSYPKLAPMLTVFDNVKVPLSLRNDLTLEEKNRRIYDTLEEFEMNQKKNYLPSNLSETEKQKVSLVRLFVSKPDILLLDEPFNKVDNHTAEKVVHKLKQLANDGCTIIITSKFENIYSAIDKVIQIENGKLIDAKV